MAIQTYSNLRGELPQLRLILAPRHPERAAEVASLLEATGLAWWRRSTIEADMAANPEARILLVDTVGELGAWWGAADIGFVGGSMGTRGGQNMLEPAGFGVATCFGPNTKNFRDVVQLLLQAEAATVVHDQRELQEFVRECATSAARRAAQGNAAQRLVVAQRGAADNTVQIICDTLPSVARAA